MAFSFRNLFSQGDEDSENEEPAKGLPDREVTPKGYFTNSSRGSIYEALMATSDRPQDDKWQARQQIASANSRGELAASQADLPTCIPINRLAGFLPASFLRDETALLTEPIDLAPILHLEREPAAVFSLHLSHLFELIPELFTREFPPADDQKILIPADQFHDTKPASELLVTAGPTVPTEATIASPATRATSLVSTSDSLPSSQSSAKATSQPVIGKLPQRRLPGVPPFTGEDFASPQAQATSQGSRSSSSGTPGSPFGNLNQSSSGPSSSPSSPPPSSSSFPPQRPSTPSTSLASAPIGENSTTESRPGADPLAEKTPPNTVTFNLKRILQAANPDDLGFDPSRIPPHVTVDIQREHIESHSAVNGLANVPIEEIIQGCEKRHRPAFARAKPDLLINVPLEETRAQQVPADEDDSSSRKPAMAAASKLPRVVNPGKQEDRRPDGPSVADEARAPAPVSPPPSAADRLQFGAPHSPPESANGITSPRETLGESPAAEDPNQQPAATSQPRPAQVQSTPALNSPPGNPPVFGSTRRPQESSQPPTTKPAATAASEVHYQARNADHPESSDAPASGTAGHATKQEAETAVANALRQIMQGIGDDTDQPEKRSTAEPESISKAAQTQPKPLKTLTHKPFPSSENPELPKSPPQQTTSQRIDPNYPGSVPRHSEETAGQTDTTAVRATVPADSAGSDTPTYGSERQAMAPAADPATDGACSTVLEFRAEEIPRQLELRAIFGISRPIDLQEVIDRCETLSGINGCLVVTPAKVTRASTGNHATGARADFYQRAAKVYDSVIKLAGEIGIQDVSVLNVKTASGTHSYFRHDNHCLAVMLDRSHLAEGVREKLILVARELPALTEHS